MDYNDCSTVLQFSKKKTDPSEYLDIITKRLKVI